MEYSSLPKLPLRVQVSELVSSRYSDGERPESWDKRVAGVDVVKTDEHGLLKLRSDGGQSPPKPSWILLVSGGDAENGYHWTLYGMSRKAA